MGLFLQNSRIIKEILVFTTILEIVCVSEMGTGKEKCISKEKTGKEFYFQNWGPEKNVI